MEGLACDWSPKIIVDLIKSIAWPVVVLLIGFRFRIRIFDIIRSFLSKNTVSEISATVAGISAKFIAAKQSAESLEKPSTNNENLSTNTSAETLKERHDILKTEFSEDLYNSIIEHVSSLSSDNEEKIILLSRELSLFQSAMAYLGINKLLFLSQYELLHKASIIGGRIGKEDVIMHFNSIKNNNEALVDWDWIKYIEYPVGVELIYEEDNIFKLTSKGRSYIKYMSMNPQLIDELSKL